MLLSVWDTPGKEEYDLIRPYYYLEADVFLLCFSISSDESFLHVTEKWEKEIKNNAPKIPIVLAGMKGDKRRNCPEKCISKERCVALAKQIGATKYLECSAMTGEGVAELFKEATMVLLKEKKNCVIL